MLAKQVQNVERRYLYIELPYLCPIYNIHIQSEIFMSKTRVEESRPDQITCIRSLEILLGTIRNLRQVLDSRSFRRATQVPVGGAAGGGGEGSEEACLSFLN